MAKGRKRGTPSPRPQIKGPIVDRNKKAIDGWKDRIIEAMQEQKYSQRALSARAGLGVTSLRYLINDAATISLDTAAMLASALGMDVKSLVTGEQVSLDIEEGVGKVRMKVLNIKDADLGREDTHGVVALPADYVNGHVVSAFKQYDSSMEERGMNEPVDSDLIVREGDVVIWSDDDKPKPGSLVILTEKVGKDSYLAVRRLGREGEDYVVLANNADFGRRAVKLEELLGGVVAIHRPIRH